MRPSVRSDDWTLFNCLSRRALTSSLHSQNSRFLPKCNTLFANTLSCTTHALLNAVLRSTPLLIVASVPNHTFPSPAETCSASSGNEPCTVPQAMGLFAGSNQRNHPMQQLQLCCKVHSQTPIPSWRTQPPSPPWSLGLCRGSRSRGSEGQDGALWLWRLGRS